MWLACLPSVRCHTLPTGELVYALNAKAPSNSLADELVALLEKAGRAMPLAQLMGKLPKGVMVSEPMLRAVAMQDARLKVKGPLLQLVLK